MVRLMKQVAAKLKALTPELIAGQARLKGEEMLSHETIYLQVYAEKVDGGRLYTYLPQSRKRRSKRINGRRRRGQIPGRVSISERPAEASDRQRRGDLEIDTIIGKGQRNGLLRIVDRAMRHLRIRYLPDLGSETTTAALIDALGGTLVRSITSDNGEDIVSKLCAAVRGEPAIPAAEGI